LGLPCKTDTDNSRISVFALTAEFISVTVFNSEWCYARRQYVLLLVDSDKASVYSLHCKFVSEPEAHV
jgi:hypothetical protein